MKITKNYPYLTDTDFLEELVNLTNVVYYVKITLLNWQQEPITEIEEKVISADININGNSAVRRVANISFAAEENDTQIASILELNKKFIQKLVIKIL